MSKDEVRVFLLPLEGLPGEYRVKNDLSAFQSQVGGYIEYVRLPRESFSKALRLVVNEEGRMERLPINGPASKLLRAMVVGPAFVVRTAGAGTTDLTDSDLSVLKGYS
jgi:hypothetical protein